MGIKYPIFFLVTILLTLSSCVKTYNLVDYGVKPGTAENMTPIFIKALESIKNENVNNEEVKINLASGTYNFHPATVGEREYYISNHDQDNPKSVGLPFEQMKNVTFDGGGANFIFHGRMLPLSVVESSNCTFKNFSIDFKTPHISQVKVLANDTLTGIITYEIAPWVNYEVKDSTLYVSGEGWEATPSSGIAFDGNTKRLVYRTSDIGIGTRHIVEVSPRTIQAFNWKNKKLTPGTVIAMRLNGRPTPGIFITHATNTIFDNVKVHYAEGMGLLAQMSENITLNEFSVCLRGEDDPRYFTTQADATHFSACKGKIISKNGLYEGMMDDAINIHGTYLKVEKRLADNKLLARYMHAQSWGFEWGRVGDTVQFVDSKTMELIGTKNRIAAITAVDKPINKGVKQFEITFEQPVDSKISETGVFGIENLAWTPEVLFADNVIKNNRARGTLFSTPKKVVVENNIFDHTSGTAILLCGDCNGWFETGACQDVTIRNNRFINSLTNMFQFTNAVISIYPEIPDLKGQKKYFHRGIVIENNEFDTFDAPILYAKSVDGLVFKHNIIKKNSDYPAFHWNTKPFFFERVVNVDITDNQFEGGFDLSKDVRAE